MAPIICIAAVCSLIAFMWWKFVHMPIDRALDDAFGGDGQ